MAKRRRSTRRTVSMPGVTFRRLKHALATAGHRERNILAARLGREWETRDLTCAGIVTALIEDLLDDLGEPVADPGPQPSGVGGRPRRSRADQAAVDLSLVGVQRGGGHHLL